ncbi:exocyst complex component 6B isoform X2 [Tetranychus urticae]|uniref:Exocyst complex component n=1 Tax=Tetranychus urticae TaxID=32264 RepID=T1K0Q9_TETUR|nr:exocyst complex component 6B isoform X2 [Tetranychus urticae]
MNVSKDPPVTDPLFSKLNGCDHLLIELESNDPSSLSLVLSNRAVGDEYDKFMEKLDARIKSHDEEIKRMCNANYQDFVDCIHDLLQVRPKADILKKEILEVNQDIQKSSENVQRKAEELIRYRKIVCNIETAIDHLSQCLPVLKMYSKLTSQMENTRYYPALKTLEQLENNFLPRVSHYRFAQAMRDKIPQIREQIKEASMSDLKDFLENVRQLSSQIGEIAMKNAAHQQNIEDTLLTSCTTSASSSNENSSSSSPVKKSTTILSINSSMNNINEISSSVNNTPKGPAIASRKKHPAPKPPLSASTENDLDLIDSGSDIDLNGGVSEEELKGTDIVDFSPVYRCLHIFGCLGARELFEIYYRQQRQQQAKLVLQPPTNMHENIDGYKNYFCGVVGFFVIENHILNTAPGLITKSYLDEVWENALQSVIASLRTYSSYCTDENLMLKIKRIIILFSQTLQSYGYNVNPFLNLLIEIRDQYNEILMKQWCALFRSIFDADNYHPIEVESQAEYDEIINEFPYYEAEVVSTGDSDYPKKFPFSSFVPKVFTQVKRFINACREFSQDLNISQTEIEDMVRKSTNLLLTRTLSGCLSVLIKKPSLGLLQLIQIAINTNYLEDSMSFLEEYISQPLNTGLGSPLTSSTTNIAELAGGSHLAKLQGSSMFKDARSDAESQIYFLLNQKIDEFFEIAHYDWMLVESSGVASSYIADLIKFLTSTFQAFTNLPLKVAQTACVSACKHIASSLINFLLDEDVKAISMGALEQFNLDLLQCEFFASSEPVKGFEDNALQMCFAELRQLVDLLLSWQWSTYIADYGKQDNKYLRVNPQMALNLLEKIKEADKNRNIFASLKKNERDKRKLVDTVIKQLKQLIAAHNSN